MAKLTTRHPAMAPSHPGELLREVVLPALPNTKKEVAETLGVSRQTLDKLLNEQQRVTPDIAAGLARCSATAPVYGFGCRRPSTPIKRNKSTCPVFGFSKSPERPDNWRSRAGFA